jgi:pimeloyl-ACP methyl ester carboxylesterase
MAGTMSAGACLAHQSFNDHALGTVVLIHGVFSTSNDWDLVVTYLVNYHVLVPDLLGHGQSRTITPFSVPFAASLVRDLILEHAHCGIAHVVGHSIGAHIVAALASQYPNVVFESFGLRLRSLWAIEDPIHSPRCDLDNATPQSTGCVVFSPTATS